MTQTGRFTQPPQQLFRQAIDAARDSEDTILYRYAGPCSEAGLSAAATDVKQAVARLPVRVQRHLFASFIELFQNVDRYGVSHHDEAVDLPCGEFTITARKAGGYSIHAANLIPTTARAELEASLLALQGLDRTSLAKRYRDQLPKPCAKDAPSGAAGLGLIELAKRCQSQLSFSFLPVHESCYLFTISLHFQAI